MSDQMNLISTFETARNISIGVAILGLVLAVFFFFYFDIPTVRAMMTGRAKRKTVEKLNERGANSGALRAPQQATVVMTSGMTEQVKEHIIEETTVLSDAPADTMGQTAPLTPAMEETAVLNAAPAAGDFGETMVLSSAAPVIPSNFTFEVTEEIISINTNELI